MLRHCSFFVFQCTALRVGIYLLKVNNGKTRIMCKICSKIAFVVNFEQTGLFPNDAACYQGDLFKGAFSGLRQFLATEGPLKMMKNTFYFILKALFRSQDI